MARKILHHAATPVAAYRFWHGRWCEILSATCRQAFLDAGLAGASFTERVEDAPDGTGGFSYRISETGEVHFIAGEGEAVAEYDCYELGFRMLSDPSCEAAGQIAAGKFRIISGSDRWVALMSLMPLLRQACHQAIADTEEKFDLEFPKYG